MKLLDDEEIDRVLRGARRVAVLGIKPESRRERSAHDIPAYLARVGYEIIPVPVYYPEVTEILSVPVYRSLREVPGTLDILSVFRRQEHIAAHLEDILAAMGERGLNEAASFNAQEEAGRCAGWCHDSRRT